MVLQPHRRGTGLSSFQSLIIGTWPVGACCAVIGPLQLCCGSMQEALRSTPTKPPTILLSRRFCALTRVRLRVSSAGLIRMGRGALTAP
jgi:hypothetical protein